MNYHRPQKITFMISCLIICLGFTLPAWSLTINSGAIDVGSADTLLFQADLNNSSEAEELSWVKSVLGVEVTFDYKVDSFNWLKTDNTTGEIYATALQNSPEYFLIKMGNIKIEPINYSHFLFENLADLSYAVIDLADFGADINNINIFKVSHVTALTEINPVPEPATVFLFGIGLLGIAGLGRKTRKK